MATDTDNVLVGAGVLSVSDYVTAGGAGAFTDIGHSRSLALTKSQENFDVETDRAFGIIKRVPTKASLQLNGIMDECTLENVRVAFGQLAGSLTGTPPDMTLLIGEPEEQYHQLTVDVIGVGTTAARTWTFWKCFAGVNGEIPFQKAAVANVPFTFECLYDDSVATADKFGKVVDA